MSTLQSKPTNTHLSPPSQGPPAAISGPSTGVSFASAQSSSQVPYGLSSEVFDDLDVSSQETLRLKQRAQAVWRFRFRDVAPIFGYPNNCTRDSPAILWHGVLWQVFQCCSNNVTRDFETSLRSQLEDDEGPRQADFLQVMDTAVDILQISFISAPQPQVQPHLAPCTNMPPQSTNAASPFRRSSTCGLSRF